MDLIPSPDHAAAKDAAGAAIASSSRLKKSTLGGIMNFFGIVGATISPYLSGVIAQATGAFVAPLVLAVCIMLVSATTMILFFHYRPLSELVADMPAAAKFAT
jgi:fucose permease